jgi:hypothetical protein
MAEITEQIVREAPDIEKRKVALMDAAKLAAEEVRPEDIPAYQVAGMSQAQRDALAMGQAGIGSYQPFMQQAGQSVRSGSRLLGEGANILRGSDTRGQFSNARDILDASQQANIGLEQDMMRRSVQQAEAAGPQFGQAQGTLGMGIGALAGAAQGFSPSNVQAFMNPYQQQVIDESMRQINRQGDIARQNLQAQAVRAGAFGGSRGAIQQAELERGLSEQRNAAITGALSQGYQSAAQQAQQAFEQQQQRQLAQAQGYQGAAGLMGNLESERARQAFAAAQYGGNIGQALAAQQFQQANLGQQAAGMYGNLAQQQFGIGSQLAAGIGSLGSQMANVGLQQGQLGEATQRMGQQDVNFLYGLGGIEQQQRQRELDAQRATELQRVYQPYQDIAFVSDIYKGAPSSQMALTTQSAPAPSPFQQVAGVGTGLLATGAAMKNLGVFNPNS